MATTNLPAIPHPLSRMEDPTNLNVRGLSREGSRVASRQSLTFGQDLDRQKLNVLRPITADQVPYRLTRSSNGFGGQRSPRYDGFAGIPEGVEVKFAEDPNKPTIPIFGSRADMASRAESRLSRLNSAASSLQGPDRASVDEIEALLREKMKTGYYDIRGAFKNCDPEGKGIVNREKLREILINFLSRSITLSHFNKLMVRLRLDHKKMISYDEFYAAFRPPKKADEGPAWLQLEKPDLKYMSAAQVHAHLKEKAKQRFLDVAELIPQMNPGGSGRILRPELRNVLNKMGFYMEDDEFEKLWQKYDTENYGTIRAERLMSRLGIAMKDTGSREVSSSPRKLEAERKHSLDVERWLKRKFREGFSDMKHAFMELDLDRIGKVSLDDFRMVMKDFGLRLDTDKQLDDFIARCGIEASNGKISYKEFLRRFQDRSEQGMPHKILANPLHRYHHSEGGSNYSTTSAIEARMMDMFQKEFLALLGTFHNIDRKDSGLLTQQQFRAAIEGRFELNMSEQEFESFLKKVPIDSDGMVKYVEFMSKFDTFESKSLFDRSSIMDRKEALPTLPEIDSPPMSPKKQFRPMKTMDSYNSQEGRSVEELKALIKSVLQHNYQAFEEAFYELDELNSKKMSPNMMIKLLKKFGLPLSRNEVKRLWDTLITDQRGSLEYWQFVRTFGYSLDSAAFPNAKVSPPKRGDNDFMMRSNKLNSDKHLLHHLLKSNIDFHWETLWREFTSIDRQGTGNVSRKDFTTILQDMCVELTDYECQVLCDKFDPKKEGRINYIKFLEPYSKHRRAHRHGHNMQAVMKHPQAELPMDEIVQKPSKGLSTVTAKLRDKLSGKWINLMRAFKKLDKDNKDFLSLQEFRHVLELCNVVLDEEDIYYILTEFDENRGDKIRYTKFLDKIK
ncbi:EF-hand calcium-binding domain-containing protein 6-like [Pocillopora damicornis]|uniref:EF-hand calcium-binding domain-containing protein 6-like n=1 Tax=Pocillopora damicornis TaxID=46731 RepID=UPI000F554563|nr:EF-hand calcium-binding domain-containing protein 6-like [Pocillopora damicornis]